MGKWMRAVVLTGVIATGCGSDGNDCDRYAEVTCEKACACSSDPACTVVWGASVYTLESRTECERTLGDICRGESRFDPDVCLESVEETSCSGPTYVHPLCPLGGGDAGGNPFVPAILEVNAPERSPLDTVAIRGRAANATRVALQLEGGQEAGVTSVTPGGDFCFDMPLPAAAVSTFVLHAIDDVGAVSAAASVEVAQDAGAAEPAEPTCTGGQCAADEDCGNDVDDDCNALVDECDPACNGCADDDLEPNDVPFSVPALADGTYPLEICRCREDWFAFELPAGGSVGATATFENVEIDIDLQLFRAADAEVGLDGAVASSMATTDVEPIDYTSAAGGTYYLRVYSFRADSTGGYVLEVGASP